MGNLLCMGLFLCIPVIPTPRCHHTHHGLAAGVDVNMFDRDFLLAFSAMTVESIEQHCPGSGKFVRLAEVFASSLERLVADHRSAVAFHRGIVGGDQLRRHHAFQFVLWCDPDQRGDNGA